MQTFLLTALVDESKHFFAAALLGSLAYWWTSTTLSVSRSKSHHSTQPQVSMAAGYFIRICSLLLALALALLSHWLLDF